MNQRGFSWRAFTPMVFLGLSAVAPSCLGCSWGCSWLKVLVVVLVVVLFEEVVEVSAPRCRSESPGRARPQGWNLAAPLPTRNKAAMLVSAAINAISAKVPLKTVQGGWAMAKGLPERKGNEGKVQDTNTYCCKLCLGLELST